MSETAVDFVNECLGCLRPNSLCSPSFIDCLSSSLFALVLHAGITAKFGKGNKLLYDNIVKLF